MAEYVNYIKIWDNEDGKSPVHVWSSGNYIYISEYTSVIALPKETAKGIAENILTYYNNSISRENNS